MSSAGERLTAALADRYRIEREVGQGGMATVYLAQDLKHERQVAIKVLREDLAASLGAGRFLREVKIAAQLQHPNILPLLDSGEADGFLYFVMPYIKGHSLRERLDREGELPVAEAMRLLTEVVDALVLAHEHGVVHRDIKPDNVMLSGRHALVTDFGVAKAISEATGRNTVTTLGVAVGTPTYMSPEQAAADPHVDHRSDIYSVGVMAYEMLAGRPPFTGATPQQVLAAHVTQEPDLLSRHRPGLPAALEALVMRCLAKRPADRWQTAGELHAALEPFAVTSGGITPAEMRPVRTTGRKRMGWIVATVAALLLMAAVGYGLSRSGGQKAATAARAIAVLPFDNVGRDTSVDYLGDGMANDLRGGLMTLPGLLVKARTSSDAARGKPVHDAGALLNVGVVLQGAFRRAGDHITVTAELVNVADESALWTGNYVLPADGNFSSAQDAITAGVAGALGLRVGGAAATAQNQRGTDDADAYDLYLKGQFLFARRGADNLRRAVDDFKAAIARDSNFARAYGGLATSLTILPAYSQQPGDALVREAERAARRALALDSTLTDARLGLANALTLEGRPEEADQQYVLAIARDPRNATAHQWRGSNLTLLGRADEAVRENRLATELDPLSAVALNDLGYTLIAARRFDDAMPVLRRAIELDPNFLYVQEYVGIAYTFTGHPDSAIAAYNRVFRIDSTAPTARAYHVWGLVLAGEWAAAERDAEAIGKMSGGSRDEDLAIADIALGRTGPALDLLERATRERSYYMAVTALGCDPTFDRLKSDSRYPAIVKQFGQGICPAASHWPIPARPGGSGL